jgi:hypothetical protein
MGQRGRASTAALSVVAGTDIDGRPKAPSDLTAYQTEVWERTVANEGADTFKTAALQQLLKEYCRHVSSAALLTEKIDSFDSQWLDTDEGLERYTKLVRTRDCETKALADKATKLRLTNQSRYTPGAAGTASKSIGSEKKPWQSLG